MLQDWKTYRDQMSKDTPSLTPSRGYDDSIFGSIPNPIYGIGSGIKTLATEAIGGIGDAFNGIGEFAQAYNPFSGEDATTRVNKHMIPGILDTASGAARTFFSPASAIVNTAYEGVLPNNAKTYLEDNVFKPAVKTIGETVNKGISSVGVDPQSDQAINLKKGLMLAPQLLLKKPAGRVTEGALGAAEMAMPTASKAAGFAGNLTKKAVKSGIEQFSGITPEAQSTLFRGGNEFLTAARKGEFTPREFIQNVGNTVSKRLDALDDTGSLYDQFRSSPLPIVTKKTPLQIIENHLKKRNIEFSDGKIAEAGLQSNAKVSLNSSDVKALQDLHDIAAGIKNFDTNNFLNLRKALDNLVAYDNTPKTKKVLSAIRGDIRSEINNLRPKKLAEIDKIYAPEKSLLDEVKKDIFKNSVDPETGQRVLKDSVESFLMNIGNKGKGSKLERLSKVVPELPKMVDAMKTVRNIDRASAAYGGGSAVTKAALSGGAGFLAGGLPGAVLGAVASNPRVIASTISGAGKVAQGAKSLAERFKDILREKQGRSNVVNGEGEFINEAQGLPAPTGDSAPLTPSTPNMPMVPNPGTLPAAQPTMGLPEPSFIPGQAPAIKLPEKLNPNMQDVPGYNPGYQAGPSTMNVPATPQVSPMMQVQQAMQPKIAPKIETSVPLPQAPTNAPKSGGVAITGQQQATPFPKMKKPEKAKPRSTVAKSEKMDNGYITLKNVSGETPNKIAYHGTQAKEIRGNPNPTNGSMGKAFYLTDSKSKAGEFGREKRVVNDTITNSNGKKVKQILRESNGYKDSQVFDFDTSDLKIKNFNNDQEFFNFTQNADLKELSDWFKLAGYDGAYIKDKGTYAIYDTSRLKNLSNKPLERVNLGETAKKYDSVQSFIDGEFPQGVPIRERSKYAEIWKNANKDKLDAKKELDAIQKQKIEEMRAKRKAMGDIPEEKYSDISQTAYKGSRTLYHGTALPSAEEILRKGFVSGADLPENAYRGGGYGKSQSTISFSLDPEKAKVFGEHGGKNSGAIIEATVKPDAKIIRMRGIEDATDLEKYMPDLKKDGIDGVFIGGGESELVIVNPKVIDTKKMFEPQSSITKASKISKDKDTATMPKLTPKDIFLNKKLPSNKYITVYHRTNSPKSSYGSKPIFSKENKNEFFVSNRPNEQISGYGKNLIKMRVPKKDLEINDEFPTGEIHYTINTRKADEALRKQKEIEQLWQNKKGTPRLPKVS